MDQLHTGMCDGSCPCGSALTSLGGGSPPIREALLEGRGPEEVRIGEGTRVSQWLASSIDRRILLEVSEWAILAKRGLVDHDLLQSLYHTEVEFITEYFKNAFGASKDGLYPTPRPAPWMSEAISTVFVEGVYPSFSDLDQRVGDDDNDQAQYKVRL